MSENETRRIYLRIDLAWGGRSETHVPLPDGWDGWTADKQAAYLRRAAEEYRDRVVDLTAEVVDY